MPHHLHYSIFRGQATSGEIIYINLAEVRSAAASQSGGLHVWIGESNFWALDRHNREAFLVAWDTYARINAAAKLVKLPDAKSHQVACNSAFMLDAHFDFIATQEDETLPFSGEQLNSND